MFTFNKPLELPPQLKWKYAREPELLGWTIRARNYSTFVANTGFALYCLVPLGWAIFLYSTNEGRAQPWRTLWPATLFTFLALIAWSGLGQRVNLAYRFTKTGWEYCQWKDTPKWHLTAVKWVTGLMVVVCFFLISIDPSLILVALIGPGGMAITCLAMANSETYQDLQAEYSHVTFKWNEFHKVAIATNREVVDLKYRRAHEDIAPYYRNVNIFCKKKKKEAVAAFIRGRLPPDMPFARAKLNTMMEVE